jgi:8-oxo-dGTP diphosphatase
MVKVVTALIEKEGKILIARRKKEDSLKGKWEFPGGKVEEDESPEEALKRELREELGIEVRIGDLRATTTYDYAHMSVELMVYEVYPLAGEMRLIDHEEFRWVPRAELGSYDFPDANVPIIRKLMMGKK